MNKVNTEFIDNIIEKYNIKKISLSEIDLKQEIGKGSQAKVFKGLYEDKLVAVRVLKSIDEKCFEREITILSTINHLSIPKFYGIVNSRGVLATVIEYVNGKSLENYAVETISEENKYKITYLLLDVIQYIHSNNYIHRDIKPDNIIISDSFDLHLIDFGIAKIISDDEFTALTRAMGTLAFLAPESLEAYDNSDEDKIISMITNKVDIWSFGCVVAYLFSGIKPWLNLIKDVNTEYIKTLLSDKEFPIPENITDECIRNIILNCTIRDIDKRASINDIKANLKK